MCTVLLTLSTTTDSVEITNKMQPCNRIYYSTVHWQLNMFRAAYRSSSGALSVFAASGLHKHVVTGRSQVWVETPTQTWLRPVTTCACKPKIANTVRAPDDERFAAGNMNGGIINSVTRLHLVGYFCWVILRCTDPWILNKYYYRLSIVGYRLGTLFINP